ncbi:hypothetical protein [Clostridium saccharoperbutylacetonicum]|uniref:hypothetical protein n=1 Tax=Clostridium saccharoperbutylacetonicum TaxID=36745 RepID=UPI0039E8AE0D
MDEKTIKEYIDNSCRKYGLLYSDKKIVISSEKEIRIHININQNCIQFSTYIQNTNFETDRISYTIDGMYRHLNQKDQYKDFNDLESAVLFCIKTILEK